MLHRWRIQQFKAIQDSGEISLAPITVFSGRNSSGKTSFLQSILRDRRGPISGIVLQIVIKVCEKQGHRETM